MSEYEYMLLKACECYRNSDLINESELGEFIQTIYAIKTYLESKKNEKMDT